MLHLIPLSAFDSPTEEIELDTRRPPLNRGLLHAFSWGGPLHHNFDGALAEAQMAGGKIGGYAQLYRSGVLEAVDNIAFNEGTDGSEIASVYFEKFMLSGGWKPGVGGMRASPGCDSWAARSSISRRVAGVARGKEGRYTASST